MKLYICCGDEIISKNDGNMHYISAQRLSELYGVNPDECFFVDKQHNRGLHGYPDGLLILTPRYNGDYQEHLSNIKGESNGER